ncbi:hypothetical protein ABIE45_000130 [Methylobacterium sp. OAE515]|uniref:hypothetical protein n=1 Tax=Methylobacterium sp. OAE515 TaxID=2817895 RepID=UPI00178BD4B3
MEVVGHGGPLRFGWRQGRAGHPRHRRHRERSDATQGSATSATVAPAGLLRSARKDDRGALPRLGLATSGNVIAAGSQQLKKVFREEPENQKGPFIDTRRRLIEDRHTEADVL